MSYKSTVFREIHYSTDDNGRKLIVDRWVKEARISVSGIDIEIGCTREDLEDWRDLFQAALDDMEKDNG